MFADKTYPYDGLGAAGAAMDDLAHRRTWGKVVVHPCAAAPAPGRSRTTMGRRRRW